MIKYIYQISAHISTCVRGLDGQLVYAVTCLGFSTHNKQTKLPIIAHCTDHKRDWIKGSMLSQPKTRKALWLAPTCNIGRCYAGRKIILDCYKRFKRTFVILFKWRVIRSIICFICFCSFVAESNSVQSKTLAWKATEIKVLNCKCNFLHVEELQKVTKKK